MSIKIEIDLSKMGLTEDEDGDLIPGPDLAEQIASDIVERVYERITTSEHSPLAPNRLWKAIEEKVEAVIRGVVTDQISEFIAGPIQKHDRYHGTPVGEPTTIREMTMTAVEKYLTAPNTSRDNINRGVAGNLGELVDAQVKAALSSELKPTIDAAKKELRETIITRAVQGAVDALTPPVR